MSTTLFSTRGKFSSFKKALAVLFLIGSAATTKAHSGGEQCFTSPTKPAQVSAKITWTYNAGNQTYTIRTTLARTFVDNTYGVNKIGWPKGHNLVDFLESDNLELTLYDGANVKKMEFALDYFSKSKLGVSGYKSLGISGGEGSISYGRSTDIVSARTSMDVNFNDYKYILTTNSPATNGLYTPNPSYPLWIFDVWYEVTVKASAFGTKGFGRPNITGIHASPSKTRENQECVVPTVCPNSLRLGNLIFADINKNGIRDAGEAGIPNVTVNLYTDNNGNNTPDGPAIATTKTDANGKYLFSGLYAGNYIVGIIIPAGYESTGSVTSSGMPNNNVDNDNNGVIKTGSELRSNTISLTLSGEPSGDGDDNLGNLTLDFGLKQKLRLGNLVFQDVNDNGTREEGEPGLPNITVSLYADVTGDNIPDGAALATTQTDANGNYAFSDLSQGSYVVGITIPSGYQQGAAASTSMDPDNDTDNDQNGVIRSGDELRSNAITLTPGGEPVDDGDDATGNLTLDFALVQKLKLGDLVFFDRNKNGVRDEGEPGLAGVSVSLYADADGNNTADGAALASTTTDANGTYAFANLSAGKYIVGIIVPSGFRNTAVVSGSNNPDNDTDNDHNGVNAEGNDVRSNSITLTYGGEPTADGDDVQGNLTLDFGLVQDLRLGNLVFGDNNNNGVFDNGEAGMPNVAVSLYADRDGNSIPDGSALTSTVTDANGNYGFSGLAEGNYVVGITVPAGYQPGTATLTSADPNNDTDNDQNGVTRDGSVLRSQTITLSLSGEPANDGDDVQGNLTLDFGLVQDLSLGNLVFHDTNNNGVYDIGEPGLSKVTAALYADSNNDNLPDGPALATTVTDENGKYRFSGLSGGSYIVGITIPAGYEVGAAAATSADPNNDTDNDQNGVTKTGTELRSNYITLSHSGEPVNDGDDAQGNGTLDFALVFPCPMVLTGSATPTAGEGRCFQLTPPDFYKKGAVFSSAPIDLANSFAIEARLQFGTRDGADGIAFVLQKEGPNYIGNHGAGIGYHRFDGLYPSDIKPDVPGPVASFIVEFDTYQNGPIGNRNIGDPAQDHLGFMSNSSAYHTSTSALAPPQPFTADIEDGQWHDVTFTWNAVTKTMTVVLVVKNSPMVTQTFTYTGDIVNNLFNGNGNVYWGFTASTGSYGPNQQSVCIKSFCPPTGATVPALTAPVTTRKTVLSEVAQTEVIPEATGFRVFPNPSNGPVEVQISGADSEGTLEIMTANGGLLERRSINGSAKGKVIRLDLGRHGAGLYMIKLTTASGVQTQKVIIR